MDAFKPEPDQEVRSETPEKPRCSNPDGVEGDIWRDADSDKDYILVKYCSQYGNWVEQGKELKVK